MRILVATGLYAPEIGGPATYTAFLEKHMANHGIPISVVPFRAVRKYPKVFRHLLYTIALLRRARQCDVLVALDTVSVGLPVLCASIITRKPYVLRVPGDYAWEQGHVRFGITESLDDFVVHTKHPWQVRILQSLQCLVAMRAKHIIVPSEYLKKIVSAWGIAPERITRIYSELKEITVSEERGELRTQFQYEDFVIATAARLTPWKGVKELITVVHTLREEGLPVSLEIMGDGVCAQDVRMHIETLGAGAYVHMRGAVPRNELARRIKAADVFVLNTAYEGLSHQLIEVMHGGTPIVTTAVGGNTELITHEENGLLVPYGDTLALAEAIRRVINNPAAARVLATKAHAETSRFHEDVIIKEVVHFFNSLAQGLKHSL